MVKYSKISFDKDLSKLKSLINKYNKMNGGGYDMDPGRAVAPGYPLVAGYADGCAPTIPENQLGGSILQPAVSTLCKILAPMGKKELASVATLLALNEIGKRQRGGGNLTTTLSSALMPIGKNNLLVLVSLLLLNYFMKLHPKRTKTHRGGGISHLIRLLAPVGTNAFSASLLLLVLSNAFNKGKRRQRGGAGVLSQLERLVVPLGTSSFSVAALLVILNKIFSRKVNRRHQRGGSMTSLLSDLTNLLSPRGLNVFLTTVGLLALTKNPRDVRKSLSSTLKTVQKSTRKVVSTSRRLVGVRKKKRSTKRKTRK